MSGDVKIILQQEDNVLVVPIDALNQEDDNYYLWVKTHNSTLEKKEVTIGIETDQEVQIIQGINPDDQIIIKKK